MQRFVIFSVLLLSSYASAGLITTGSCGGVANFTQFTLDGCSGAGACELRSACQYEGCYPDRISPEITVVFTPTIIIAGGRTSLSIGPTLLNHYTCDSYRCPMMAGTEVFYRFREQWLTPFISERSPYTAEFKITGADGVVQVCRTLTLQFSPDA